LGDGLVPLFASLAKRLECFFGHPPDLKAAFPAVMEPVHNLVAVFPHRTRQGVPVDFGEVTASLIDGGCLQGLPASFHAIVGQIGSDQMGVQLGVEFPASVMVVTRQDQIAGSPILIGTFLTDTGTSQRFHFGSHLPDGFQVSLPQPGIDQSLDGNRFRSGHRKVVERAGGAGPFAFFVEPVSVLPGPEEGLRHRIEPLPNGIELFHPDFAREVEQPGSAAHPLTHYLLVF